VVALDLFACHSTRESLFEKADRFLAFGELLFQIQKFCEL
jgi:hypothetical protein